MSVNDLYLLGLFLIVASGLDIIVGNLRARYEDKNNSTSGIYGALKKAIILSVMLTMMFLLYMTNEYAESAQLIAAVGGTYTTVLTALGYHEFQSVLANVQMAYPDFTIPERLYKFFNVESEIVNKEKKEQ